MATTDEEVAISFSDVELREITDPEEPFNNTITAAGTIDVQYLSTGSLDVYRRLAHGQRRADLHHVRVFVLRLHFRLGFSSCVFLGVSLAFRLRQSSTYISHLFW